MRRPQRRRRLRALAVAAPPVRVALAAAASAASVLCAEASPCGDDDWRTGFSVCTEAPDGGKRRGVFAYAPPGGVCDHLEPNSRPLPEPLLGEPCDVLCDAGTHVAVDLVHPDAGQANSPAQLRLGCRPCSTGFYSLGGGTLLDGESGDWAKPWPVNLQTYCYYRDANYVWQHGTATPRFCVLHLGPPGSDRSTDLVVETRPATWDEQLPDLDLSLPMVLPDDVDVLACNPLSGDLSRFQGAAVLLDRGECTFQQKAENAHAAGASAVVVYNNVPHDGYFFPAAADTEHMPQTPFFMITMEDGLEWREAILRAQAEGESLHLHVPSTHCRASAREALPESYRDNATDEELMQESWAERVGGLGCSEWAADPGGGGFLHSGSNLHFHQVISILEMEALFVRDGYLSFQYSVDAEEYYDGFTFYLDDVAQFTESRVDPYKTYTVDISRGPHSFIWSYSKDGSTTVREDRARLRLLELVGTSHADYECRPCSSGVGPLAAAGQCGVCGHGTYLSTETLAADGTSNCLPCPRGTWSLPGAVGQEACQRRRACERLDVEVTYTAMEELGDGTHRELPGRHCHGGRSMVRHRLKEPSTCDPTHPDSVDLPADSMEACPECQPHMSRPTGEECVAEVTRCDAGSYPARELVLSRWQVWPGSLSTEIWGGLGGSGGSHPGSASMQTSADPFRRNWQLDPLGPGDGSGAAAVIVGSAFTSARDAALAAQWGGHVDAALLHLDVVLEAPGELHFTFQMEPAGRWGGRASLLVDGAPAMGLSVPTADSSEPQQASLLGLPAGRHRLTWKWQYIDGSRDSSDGGSPSVSGVRISSISVTNARDAPAVLCSRCAPGLQLTADGLACHACPAGRSSTDYSGGGAGVLGGSCSLCPAGRAAGEGQEACTSCGSGLGSSEGAAKCSPSPTVRAAVSSSDSRTWDMQLLQLTWAQTVSMLGSRSGGGGDAGAQGLLPLMVEDKVFYLSPFSLDAHPGGEQQAADDGIAEAYWWEQVLPFGSYDAGAVPEALRTCERTWIRTVGDRLEAYEPVVQEGGNLGIAAVFTGLCDEEVTGQESGPRVRRSRLFFRCDLEADNLLDSAAAGLSSGSSGGASSASGGALHLPELSLLHGGAGDAGALSCMDLALEWRSRAACPLCRESDWVRVQANRCEPGKGRQVSFVASVPCVGGAPQPADEWEPCGQISGVAIAAIVGGAFVAVVLMCCSIVYVVLLRRRYRKYMELESCSGPTPTVMGTVASNL